MSGVFAPDSDGYADVPLLEGEHIILAQTASVDGKSIWGGQLVLTNQRLLFRPLDMKATEKLLSDGIDLFLPNNLAVLGNVVSKGLDYSSAYQDGLTGAVETTSITGVTAGRDAGLLHPPSLVISMSNGAQTTIGILKSKFTPNISPANNQARDEMIALIQQHRAAGGLT